MVKEYSNVEDYKFQSFTEEDADAGKVSTFEFKPLLSTSQAIAKTEFQNIIREERAHAKHSQFKINSIVEKYRGLKDQEQEEYQAAVDKEVVRKISEIQEEAFKAGFDEGVNQGREEIFNEMRSVVDQKLDNFSQMVTEVLKTQDEIINVQKKEIYLLIRNLTKWIITRELKEDGKYVERLLEKLLLEIQARSNLLIQVNSSDFNDMPEILKHVQSRLGEFKNVRVEIDSAITTSGIIIESDNGIINATMEEQFKSLDKLFEDVLIES
ncbi:MAG: FliH/SctL family protein [Bacteriovorax sp.]|jgi:flagellar assembly protein FliH